VYGLPTNTKETSGAISVTDYNVSQTVIEVDGMPHGMLQVGPASGTFNCIGTTGLDLNFPAGANSLSYTLVRAAGTTATTAPTS
jgi:hypothetical protein